MVVACGRSHRHVGAIADNVVDRRSTSAASRAGCGSRACRIATGFYIDANDVIVHVFRPEVREFYSLEKMWARARPAKS